MLVNGEHYRTVWLEDGPGADGGAAVPRVYAWDERAAHIESMRPTAQNLFFAVRTVRRAAREAARGVASAAAVAARAALRQRRVVGRHVLHVGGLQPGVLRGPGHGAQRRAVLNE